MKEEKDYIDQLFQSKLSERKIEIIPSFLSDMEATLDRKPKNGLWYLRTILFFVLCGSFLFLNFSDKNENKAHSASHESNATKELVDADRQDQQRAARSKPINKTTKKRKNTQVNLLIEKALTSVEVDKNDGEKTEDNIARDLKMKKHDFKSLEERKIGRNNKISSAELNSTEGNSTKSKKIDTSSFLTSQKIQNSSEHPIASVLIRSSDDSLKNREVRYIDSVIFRDSVVIRDSIRIQQISATVNKSNAQKNQSWEVQLFAGVNFFTPKIVSENSTYIATLKGNETRIASPTFGFNINTIKNNWTAGTGLLYAQYGEKTNYTTQATQQVIDTILTNFTVVFLDSNGNVWNPQSGLPPVDTITTIQQDTLYNTVTNTNTTNRQNSYSRILIPLNFGYIFSYKTWSFTPRIGVNLEFTTTRQKGLYLNAKEEEIIEINTTRFGLSYQIQFELRKQINNWHIFINPYFRNQLGYIINSTDLQRRYGGFGLNLGVGFKL